MRPERATCTWFFADVEPLGVLVEHRVDDVRKGLVRVEQTVPARQQVAFQPSQQRVLGQHLHHAAVPGELSRRRRPRVAGRPSTSSCSPRTPPAAGSTRSRRDRTARKLVMLFFMTSRRYSPSGFVFSYSTRAARAGTSTAYLRKSGSVSSLRSSPPLACGLALMRRLPLGASALISGLRVPFAVEQLFGTVALTSSPCSSFRLAGVVAYVGKRHLVRPPRALDLVALDLFRSGPALRRAQHDHRPPRADRISRRRAPSFCCARISPMASSNVAAILWCIVAGSWPSTKYGV